MDPNNQNSQDGVQPVPPAEPVQPVEPVAPVPPVEPVAEPVQPVTPVEPAAESTQPVTEPVRPVVEPAQPVTPESATPVETVSVKPPVTEQPAKKKLSGGMITLIIILVVLLVGGGIFGVLVATGAVSFGGAGGGGLFSDPTPTAELARSVCEKNGGELSENRNNRKFTAQIECKNTESSAEGFEFVIAFMTDETNEEMWKDAKRMIDDDRLKILENSDTLIKVYKSSNTSTSYDFYALYKNTYIELEVLDGNFGEQLLVELGFPDRSKGGPYAEVDENASNQLQLEQYNTKHRSNMAMLSTMLINYRSNNNGQLPEISNNTLVGFDSYLDDDFRDPKTGNKYTIVAYSSLVDSPYATDQSGLVNAPSDEAYVFYNTSCDSGTLVASNRERSYTIVHSSETGDSIYCSSSD